MTEGRIFKVKLDTERASKEVDHLFRLMRTRKIEETHFRELLFQMVWSYVSIEARDETGESRVRIE